MLNIKGKKYSGYCYGENLSEYGVRILDNLSDAEIDALIRKCELKSKHNEKFSFNHRGIDITCNVVILKASYVVKIERIL